MAKNNQHEQLLHLFERYLANDPVLISAIRRFDCSFNLTENSWQFSLPDLYQFCIEQISGMSGVSYSRFKQSLYRNPTNLSLRASGGEFSIASHADHIDRSTYTLTRLNKTTG